MDRKLLEEGGNVISDDVPSPACFGGVFRAPAENKWQGLSRNEAKEMMRPLRERLEREANS